MKKNMPATPLSMNDLKITYTDFSSSKTIYFKLNDELLKLESSLDPDLKKLEEISMHLLKMVGDEKEEISLRINWLKTLSTVRTQLRSPLTKSKWQSLRNQLAPIQTCPLKSSLISLLDKVELVQDSENFENKINALMELSIADLGEDFINLGTTARNYIVQKAIQINSHADSHSVAIEMTKLNHKLNQFNNLSVAELHNFIEEFNFLSFRDLTFINKKQMIAKLMKLYKPTIPEIESSLELLALRPSDSIVDNYPTSSDRINLTQYSTAIPMENLLK